MGKIIIALVLVFLLPKSVQAQTSFSVQPSIVELDSATSSAVITVHNAATTELVVTYSSLQLQAAKDGVLRPLLPVKAIPGITTTTDDITGTVLTIPPRSSKRVYFTLNKSVSKINLPALIFTTQPQELPKNKTASNLSGAIIVPIVQLGTPTEQSLSLTRFTAPFFTVSGEAHFEMTVANTGNTVSQTSGTLIIRDLLHNEVKRYEILNSTILPGQTRELTPIIWDPGLLIGFYTAELHLTYGNKELYRKRILVGIPLQYVGALFFIGIITSGIYLRVRKYRS